MEKKISYLDRDFVDYKNDLVEFSKKFYPDLAYHFSDASIDSWLMDINAAVADSLSYHIDRVFQETNIDSAQQPESVRAIARSNGVKIPGPKASMVEVKFTCQLPVMKQDNTDSAKNVDLRYAPIIRRGTMVNSSEQEFEVMEDIDFSSQFDANGQSDRTIIPIRDSNNVIVRYQVSKLAVVLSGRTKIFSKRLLSKDIRPFMDITLNIPNIMNVESIVVKDGKGSSDQPTPGDFFMPSEFVKEKPGMTRFFEVENLAQQSMWGTAVDKQGNPIIKGYYFYGENGEEIPVYNITKGEWKPVSHKFMTEHTEDGLKITFGPGLEDELPIGEASDFAKYQISRMLRNNNLGILPKPNSVIYIMYRVGGGQASNVPKGVINNISLLKADVGKTADISSSMASTVKRSIEVVNTIPSVSGKDAPDVSEMKNMIKYYKASQERCVTIKDYKSRIMMMPPKYGMPYRIGVTEENNKIMIYLLGLDYMGHVSTEIPDAVIRNITEYLKEYRMINDFVEIKSGRIVNLSFDITVHTDKSYNSSDIKENITKAVKDYMDTSRHEMGDSIYIGDIFREISKIDGVLNVAMIEVYNEIGNGYSSTQISQDVYDEIIENGRLKINLENSENILHGDGDSIFEIKNPVLSGDIRIVTKPI